MALADALRQQGSEDSLDLRRSQALGILGTPARALALLQHPDQEPDQLRPVDAYECPRTMREWVELRNPIEVFPGSMRASKHTDMDHTQPFTSGQRAQTRTDNLGPLGRTIHRAETHAGWQVTQIAPGVFHWISPLQQSWLVTPSHTWQLENAA